MPGHPFAQPVVVCVPTYRRPTQLARLLKALAQQRNAPAFDILVGNNEAGDLRRYPELAAYGLPLFDVIDVSARGVSAVRNAMIDAVLRGGDDVRWVACLDDDQVPDEDWLAQLVGTGERFDADLAGGPVRKTVSSTSFWSRLAADTSYLPAAEGLTTTLNEAGNLLLATRFLRGLKRTPFLLEYGRTGGEDYEFFLHARHLGARICWAPEARVVEALPDDRLSLRSFAWRFYSTSAYQARADRSYRGMWFVLRTIAVQAVKAPVVVARTALVQRDVQTVVGTVVRCVCALAGRIVGLAGVHAERYAPDGS